MLKFFFTALMMISASIEKKVEAQRVVPPQTSNHALETRLAGIGEILREQQQQEHIPGLAFAIVENDRVVYMQTLGQRDLEKSLPVTPDSIFPIGSCTKAFTSMAVARSQDKGLLSLDDHPRKYLPYFRMADPVADAGVTLRDMLSHRTGLLAYADLAAEPGVLTREEYVKAATSAKPAFPFRGKFQYSNAMYSAVGEIVGKVKHSTWEHVVETDIFAPLHMTGSLTSLKQLTSAADHATGYVYSESTKAWRPVPPPQSLEALAPGGNIAASVRDMTEWLRMLSSGGRFEGKSFVSTDTFRELMTPQTLISSSLWYALGWAIYDWNGLKVVEHNGGSQGLSALVSFIPERHVGFVFLANTSPNFMIRIGNAGKLLWPLILDEEPPSAESPRPTAGAKNSEPVAVEPPRSKASLPADFPTVDALLAKMIAAVGGESNLRRHESVEIHAVKSYENHGVTADLKAWAEAPAMRTEEEVWTASGRQVGRLRIYFDGIHGGQETTFGQDSINDTQANREARRENDFRPLLDLKQMYLDVRLLAAGNIGAENTYVLQLTPSEGKPVRMSVSQRTALVVQRETEGQSITFSDYRLVDKERVPFATTIRDSLGETSIRITQIRFNRMFPDAVFAPQKQKSAGDASTD
jgi:CubicO group peptidase (beta-lactamase class C family)